MLYAADNKLTNLPPDFRSLHRLETVFLQHNRIRSLDGTLQKAKNLKHLGLSYNELQEVFSVSDARSHDVLLPLKFPPSQFPFDVREKKNIAFSHQQEI